MSGWDGAQLPCQLVPSIAAWEQVTEGVLPNPRHHRKILPGGWGQSRGSPSFLGQLNITGLDKHQLTQIPNMTIVTDVYIYVSRSLTYTFLQKSCLGYPSPIPNRWNHMSDWNEAQLACQHVSSRAAWELAARSSHP